MSTEPSKASLIKRLGRGVITLTVTGAFVAAAGAAVVFGLDLLNERADAAQPPAKAETTPVSVRQIARQPGFSVERRFVGQIESRQTADVSFELGGRLVSILVDEGDAVEAGRVIAQLDTDLLEAERDRLTASRQALSAQLAFAKSQVERNSKLSQEGFSSVQRLDQAVANRDELEARIAETDAALAAVEIRLEKSVLRAPFAGRVAARNVDGGETLGAGQTVLRLVDERNTTVRVGVPLDIDPQQLERAKVVIGDQSYMAELENVRPDIDPVTRTRTALLTVAGAHGVGLGRTATVIVTDEVEAAGAWVPMDAVKEGRGSVWTVLVVDDAGIVRNAAVEIMHAESDRIFVRGAFEDGAQLIETGPQRVVAGQAVRIIETQ